jgi:ATP phosphoribosyltransferase regulatory subunit
MKNTKKITPEGTRDMLWAECEAERRITEELRGLFEEGGYREVRTPTFEFFDVFTGREDYYPQERMYTLSDARGRLAVVRPDSTVPIARMVSTKLKGAELPLRLYYAQRVYRRQQQLSGRSGEIMQMGVELVGDGSPGADTEVLRLAAASLAKVSPAGYRIEIGHVGIYKLLIDKIPLAEDQKELLLKRIASKNYAGMTDILDEIATTAIGGETKAYEILRRLPRLYGGAETVKEAMALTEGFSPELSSLIGYIKDLFTALEKESIAAHFVVDFGLVNDADYYTSIIFGGYMENAGEPVLSGGRYDTLFGAFGEKTPGAGFGINIDLLVAESRRGKLRSPTDKRTVPLSTDKGTVPLSALSEKTLRIAMTKGRLEESFLDLMQKAGYDTTPVREKGRKLLISIPGENIEIFLAKAPDVITYVGHGVCDIGIAGKDTILEQGGTYYEIMDLNIGKCRFALAAPKETDFFGGFGSKTVATKYPQVTQTYFESLGMDVDIIKIEGSVEIAPLLGLADAIVDIVETGTTLRENGLEVIEEIRKISARMIVNVSSMKLKKPEIESFAKRISGVLSND